MGSQLYPSGNVCVNCKLLIQTIDELNAYKMIQTTHIPAWPAPLTPQPPQELLPSPPISSLAFLSFQFFTKQALEEGKDSRGSIRRLVDSQRIVLRALLLWTKRSHYRHRPQQQEVSQILIKHVREHVYTKVSSLTLDKPCIQNGMILRKKCL